MKRIVVVGTSGSGKTTLAEQLSKLLDLKFIWLDELSWLPDWKTLDRSRLKARVDQLTDGDCWVCDGNYGMIRDVIWPKATHIIWLDYSFPLTFWRCLKRTLSRAWTKQKLFNGENTESFRMSFFSRDSILIWVLKTFWKHRREYPVEFKKPEHQHLNVHIFRNPKETERFVESLKNKAENPDSPL